MYQNLKKQNYQLKQTTMVVTKDHNEGQRKKYNRDLANT